VSLEKKNGPEGGHFLFGVTLGLTAAADHSLAAVAIDHLGIAMTVAVHAAAIPAITADIDRNLSELHARHLLGAGTGGGGESRRCEQHSCGSQSNGKLGHGVLLEGPNGSLNGKHAQTFQNKIALLRSGDADGGIIKDKMAVDMTDHHGHGHEHDGRGHTAEDKAEKSKTCTIRCHVRPLEMLPAQ
jgi:hypothetical protein